MADEKTLALVLKAKNLASRPVDQLHDSLGRIPNKANRVTGALKTLAKVGIGLLIGAIGALGVAFLKSIDMAIQEQKGIARLNAALKANVKGWKGNMKAIDKAITSREKLAFTDDELRDSLAILVTATGNVDHALSRQAIAMDLARLKGISLTDASTLLNKAALGNVRALKDLGIELPKTATKQQIFGAIQAKAAGQAEAYGKTSAAAQERFQNALSNLMEDIGKVALPIMTKFFNWLTEHGIPALRGIATKIGDWFEDNKPLIDQLKTFAETVLKNVADRIGKVVDWIGKFAAAIVANKPLMRALRTIAEFIGDAFKRIATVIDNAAAALGRFALKIAKTKPTWNSLADLLAMLGRLKQLPGAIGSSIIPHAAGGWVGLHGPELGLLGERGPEYITPNNRLPAMGGGPQTIILQISGQEVGRVIVPAVSRQMFFELQRAAPTLSRT